VQVHVYILLMNTRDITDKAREYTDKARELTGKLQDWQQKATETARNVGTKADDYVRENTWVSIAGAALIGCVVGFLIAGSGKRSEEEED
jgi:ElaB/YqjD/DUF883 family membrane-anchored ribosome-binding protein